MIPKSGYRFSEKIMLRREARADDDSRKSHPALARRGRGPVGLVAAAAGFVPAISPAPAFRPGAVGDRPDAKIVLFDALFPSRFSRQNRLISAGSARLDGRRALRAFRLDRTAKKRGGRQPWRWTRARSSD